jgi:hypothetical protein
MATLGCGDVAGPTSEELAEPGPSDAAYDVALAFDGVDDYASVGTGRAPQIMRDQSVLLWFQAQPGPSGESEGLQALFTMRRSDDSGWVISLDDGVPHAFNVYAQRTLARAPMPVTTTDWHHLAFVISEGSSRLYLDGAEVGAGGGPDTNRTPTHGFIGSSDGYLRMFHGKLDELRFYDRVVSADEIARAAAGEAPDADADADSLVIHLPFDEASGARSFDRSGLGNHAQLGDGVPQLMPERVRSGVPR